MQYTFLREYFLQNWENSGCEENVGTFVKNCVLCIIIIVFLFKNIDFGIMYSID